MRCGPLIDRVLNGLALAAFLLGTIFLSMWCAGDVRAEGRRIEGLTYLGTFNGAQFWQGPLGHPLSGCTIAVYDLPYSGTDAIEIGCR